MGSFHVHCVLLPGQGKFWRLRHPFSWQMFAKPMNMLIFFSFLQDMDLSIESRRVICFKWKHFFPGIYVTHWKLWFLRSLGLLSLKWSIFTIQIPLLTATLPSSLITHCHIQFLNYTLKDLYLKSHFGALCCIQPYSEKALLALPMLLSLVS